MVKIATPLTIQVKEEFLALLDNRAYNQPLLRTSGWSYTILQSDCFRIYYSVHVCMYIRSYVCHDVDFCRLVLVS